MEVNLSPSLATDAPLDAAIKSNLICEALTLVGVKKPENKRFDMGMKFLKKSSMNSSKNTSRLSTSKNDTNNQQQSTNKDNSAATVSSQNNPFRSKVNFNKPEGVESIVENDFFAKNKILFDKIHVSKACFFI
jgi:hypothetical protein